MGFLTENHRCPRGPFTRITQTLSTVLIGAIIGAVFCFVIVERPVPALVMAAAALGAVLASAVRQAVGGRPS
jgi:hypothetical protein